MNIYASPHIVLQNISEGMVPALKEAGHFALNPCSWEYWACGSTVCSLNCPQKVTSDLRGQRAGKVFCQGRPVSQMLMPSQEEPSKTAPNARPSASICARFDHFYTERSRHVPPTNHVKSLADLKASVCPKS